MPSSSVSPVSPTGTLSSPPTEQVLTGPKLTAPISTAVVDSLPTLEENGDSGHDTEHGAFSAQVGENGDSESSFWDIIADSHMKLESYGDQPYDQEMGEPVSSFTPSTAAIMSASTNLAHSSIPSTNLAVYEEYVFLFVSFRCCRLLIRLHMLPILVLGRCHRHLC